MDLAKQIRESFAQQRITCYASEDYSLVPDDRASGDDHSRAAVEARLAKHGKLTPLQDAMVEARGCRTCADRLVAGTHTRYRGTGEPIRCQECRQLLAAK
jgi:hypothetical protein